MDVSFLQVISSSNKKHLQALGITVWSNLPEVDDLAKPLTN
jgi:hypothetical protein